MKRPNHLMTALAAFSALLLAACGSGTTTGSGSLVVNGLAPGQTILCASGDNGAGPGGVARIIGTGFQSEHGSDVEVMWEAVTGTPFEGGTSAVTVTTAAILSDTVVEAQIPQGFGDIDVIITVTLPGGNSGSSEPQTLTVGGILIGPFAQTDTVPGTIGNIPTTVPAPGVLANDIPASCASEEDEETARKPGTPANTAAVEDFLVVTPPAGFEDDATPGVAKMTNLGGVVIIQADGSFTYSPPVGVTDTSDSFFYWMQEGARGPDRGFVSLPITGQVWFIDSNSDGGNNGHFDNPYQSIDDFMSEQGGGATSPGTGDTIFIYNEQGGDPYDGLLGLLNDQILLGEGYGLTIDTRLIVPPGTRPTLVNSEFAEGISPGDVVIGLADRNTIRGLAIEAPNTFGIYGFDVDGPVLIDDISIRDCNQTGILIDGGSGRIQIGDPANTNMPTVSILGTGNNGITMNGGSFDALETALVSGPTLAVFNAQIGSITNTGIRASDVNVELTGGEYDNCNVGVEHQTFFSGTCTFSADSVGSGTNTPHRFRGIVLNPNDGSAINATISNCTTISNEEALFVNEFGTGGVLVALSGNTWENLITGNIPAVLLQGGEGENVVVTQMDLESYTGNNNGGGLICSGVIFDSDPNTAGEQTVSTTALTFGNSSGARVEDTAMQLFSCIGAFDIGTLTVWQVFGNPAGYVNFGGSLTLNITTEVIDVSSP